MGAPKLRETQQGPPLPRTSCGLPQPNGLTRGAGSTLLAPGHASGMDSDQEGCGFRPASGCGLGPGLGWPAGPPAVGPACSADSLVEQGSQDRPLRPPPLPPTLRCGSDLSRVPCAHVCTHSHAHIQSSLGASGIGSRTTPPTHR